MLSLQPNNNWRRGRAARLGSAKAPTPVRIRTMPLNQPLFLRGFFMFNCEVESNLKIRESYLDRIRTLHQEKSEASWFTLSSPRHFLPFPFLLETNLEPLIPIQIQLKQY